MGLWGFGKKALNSTIGTSDFKPLDSFMEEIRDSLLVPKFTKAIIASGSFTIPKDGTYKIIACGTGGTSGKGGGGCSIDQRDYVAGDVLILTASGSASAICSARSLSMTANGTTTATGATASGGNVANHTGGTCSTNVTTFDSDGCGAGGYYSAYPNAGDGGVVGGDGYNAGGQENAGGLAGNGGIIGGKGGDGGSNQVVYPPATGGTGIFGGNGGSTALAGGIGGAGGTGIIVGGSGGNATGTTSTGGNGGDGGILGGNGGNGTTKGGKGGNAGVLTGDVATTSEGGNGAFTGMYWVIPYPEVANWTKGNAIIFIEEV